MTQVIEFSENEQKVLALLSNGRDVRKADLKTIQEKVRKVLPKTWRKSMREWDPYYDTTAGTARTNRLSDGRTVIKTAELQLWLTLI